MRKPNYNMERKDRERSKQAKAAAKLEKRAAKAAQDREAEGPAGQDPAEAAEADTPRPDR